MKHAIEQLKIAKEIAENNEPIYRQEGDLISADKLVEEIKDYAQALDFIIPKYLMTTVPPEFETQDYRVTLENDFQKTNIAHDGSSQSEPRNTIEVHNDDTLVFENTEFGQTIKVWKFPETGNHLYSFIETLEDDDFSEPLPAQTCTFEEGCESCN